ncbi:unnamed protein product, partial [Symbiodinium microadriaticum]
DKFSCQYREEKSSHPAQGTTKQASRSRTGFVEMDASSSVSSGSVSSSPVPSSPGSPGTPRSPATCSVIDDFASIVEALPNPLFTSGVAETPCLCTAMGVLSLPQDLAELKALCKQAPFGRGSETVVDQKIRRSMETQNVDVRWADLKPVLSKVRAELCPDVDLVAKLYKVLLYEPGDFFQPHVDSKVGDDHIMTLVVDCGAGDCKGGELCFPKRASQWRELEKIGRDRTWLSESGSWCCFFSSELHCVKEVTAGHRVMATFNVFGSPAQTENSETAFLRSSTQNCFLSLPRHAQQKVVLRSGRGSVYCCSCTCSFQRDLLGGPAQILQLWLGEFKERLRAEMGDKVLLGIPFHNMYSFDSSGVLRPHHLRGRDWLLYKAVVALGWHCRLVECAVSCETGWNCKGLSRARIGQDMTARSDLPDSNREIQIPERFQALAGATTLSRREMFFLTDTNGELDDPELVPHIVWPFRGVKWAVSRAYFAKRLLGESQSCDKSGPLWGNAGQFRIFYYRRAALLCEMEPCDRTDLRRSLDPDFYDLWNSL